MLAEAQPGEKSFLEQKRPVSARPAAALPKAAGD
jgi:hypothetical protein